MTEFFPAAVYLLCLLTSAACAWLLGRNFYRTGMRLLLWSSVCFMFLAANNLVLVFDLLVWPEYDLRLARLMLSLAAVTSLISVRRAVKRNERVTLYDFLSRRGGIRISGLRIVLRAILAADPWISCSSGSPRAFTAAFGIGQSILHAGEHSDRGAERDFLIRLAALRSSCRHSSEK